MVEEGSPAERGGGEPAPQDRDLGEVRERPQPAGDPHDGRVVAAVLEYLARNLVENPDAVRVTATPDERGVQLSLRVDPEDMGKVIGKGGRVARAIRSIVRAAGTRAGVATQVEIVE